MATEFLPDEIVVNILCRLQAKPLLRFRCVSKYWQSMLTDPYFIKLRSRKTIILPLRKTLRFIDVNVPTDDRTYSKFEYSTPSEQLGVKEEFYQVIGSLNGLVVLVYENTFVLCNPFTGESKKLPVPPIPNDWFCRYGFGYGATPNDLKIVRFRAYSSDICDVYDFKRDSWSSFNTNIYNVRLFHYPVATFVNGSLYWAKESYELIVLSVKDMVFSEITLACTNYIDCLGTLKGCLCLLSFSASRFKLWVRKEHCNESSWENTHSLTLDFIDFWNWRTLKILDDGRILMVNCSDHLIIYDISTDSYKAFKSLLHDSYSYSSSLHCVEYVETLVSPSVIFKIGREKEEIKDDKGKNLQLQCFT